MNPLDLTGKNILVTGASTGIGKEVAILLSQLGANLVLVARNEERLQAVLEALEPGDHSYRPFNLSDLGQIEMLIDKVCHEGIKLNGLIHAAGISATTPIQYSKTKEMQEIMTVNFFSFMELVKQLSKRKNHCSPASFVAISSISGRVGAKGLAAYCGSKGAIESAVRSLALELAPKNIRVNAIAPGMISTRIYEDLKKMVNDPGFETELLKRQVLGIGTPRDVANAAAFLLSDASRLITGTTLIVDGGYLAH